MEIFISHSQQDKAVAIEFKKMFEDFGKNWMPEGEEKVSVFLSSKLSNNQRKSDQWKENFELHMGNSSVFVILNTPKSLKSRWVQYETGYAMALASASPQKRIIQIAIRGVSPEDVLLKDKFVQTINTPDDLQELCAYIFKVPQKLAEGWCMVNLEERKKLINLCNERCVYFVGSNPTDKTNRAEWKQEFVDNFLKVLTEKLLDKGSKVSSFPTVEEVGAQVYYAAKDVKKDELDKFYEISGLYNFDKQPKTKRGDNIDMETWKKYLRDFREHYLENKDSMIIMGGKDHTKEECEVAEKLGYVELFPIPCTGGYAKRKYDEMSRNIKVWKKFGHPCEECYKNEGFKGRKTCPQLKKFAERLEQYRYINEDERES